MKGELPTNQHGEDDVSDDNSTGREDNDDINGVDHAADAATR